MQIYLPLRRVFWTGIPRNLYRLSLVLVVNCSGGGIRMSHLFAAVLLLSSPGCPHEEPTCLTPTEYVEVNLSTRILPYVVAPPVKLCAPSREETRRRDKN